MQDEVGTVGRAAVVAPDARNLVLAVPRDAVDDVLVACVDIKILRLVYYRVVVHELADGAHAGRPNLQLQIAARLAELRGQVFTDQFCLRLTSSLLELDDEGYWRWMSV